MANHLGVWPNGKALGLGPRLRWFDSSHSDHTVGGDKVLPPHRFI